MSKFTCPQCGSHMFGTAHGDVYCHGEDPPCSWNGSRSTPGIWEEERDPSETLAEAARAYERAYASMHSFMKANLDGYRTPQQLIRLVRTLKQTEAHLLHVGEKTP